MLSPETALRTFLKEERRLQKGRYKLRNTVFVFKCVSQSCTREIEVRRCDLPRVSGRCRKCADTDTARLSSIRQRKRPYEALFNKFNYDRKRAGQDNSLTYEEFLRFTQDRYCHYCGCEVIWAEVALGKNGCKYNLDRKDNALGYSWDNCIVCCWPCNELKGSRLTYDEMVVAMDAILAHRRGCKA